MAANGSICLPNALYAVNAGCSVPKEDASSFQTALSAFLPAISGPCNSVDPLFCVMHQSYRFGHDICCVAVGHGDFGGGIEPNRAG
eukprot:2269301-Rhodomonas_salina.3